MRAEYDGVGERTGKAVSAIERIWLCTQDDSYVCPAHCIQLHCMTHSFTARKTGFNWSRLRSPATKQIKGLAISD